MEKDTKTYVLYTESGKEEYLAQLLTSTIIKEHPESARRIYVPRIVRMWHTTDKNGNKHWEERTGPLFFNYVFIESNDIEAFNHVLKSLRIDTTFHIVGKNKAREMGDTYEKYPIIPVTQEDMARMESLLGEDGIVGKSTFIKEGSHVEFRSGPLKGKEADVKKVYPSKHYAILEMDFLGEKRRISMAVQLIDRDAEVGK